MAAIGIADEPETRPSEFLSRDPSITGRCVQNVLSLKKT